MGLKGPVNEPMMLQGLMTILNRKYIPRDWREMRSITSKFKSCQYGYGQDVPINDPDYKYDFHERVLHSYQEVCVCMQAYCDTFLMTEDKEKMTWLVCALIELIEEDDSISMPMYILPGGPLRSRGEIRQFEWDTVNVPALLTGCLDYVVMNVRDNRVGMDTVTNWLMEKQQPNMKGQMKQTIGAKYREIIFPEMGAPESVRFCEAQPAKSGILARSTMEDFSWMLQDTVSRRGTSVPALAMRASEHGQLDEAIATDQSSDTSRINGRYYHLFVIDPDSLTDGSFTVPKALALSMCMDAEVRSRFLRLGEEEQAILIGMPAVFATPNHMMKSTDEAHMAIFGRVTDIRLQRYDVRFRWKNCQEFPQQVLNRYASRFDVWSAPATNELDETHWSIKKAPLITLLQTMGILENMNDAQEWACREATVC